MAKEGFRAGFVGIIGAPNAGKSTLLNALVGEKVAIVSAKPQTTRERIVGIVNSPEGQMVLVDAPGVVSPKGTLNRFLCHEYEDVIRNVDVLCAMLPVDGGSVEEIQDIIALVQKSAKPWVGIVSKDDIVEKVHRVSIILGLLSDAGVPVMVLSAENRPDECREKFLSTVLPLLPESPGPLYGEDLYTTHNMRDLVREIIREKCFELLEQEVPYGLAVRIVSFNEDGVVPRIEADIIVTKANHRGIVIGKGGSMLKNIGASARVDIEQLLGTKVYLGLHVSVRKNWMENSGIMKELGYVQTLSKV
jgi:GTP-binding protein Era